VVLASFALIRFGVGGRRGAMLSCFPPLAGGRHARRAVIDVRTNVMRVGLAHGRQGCDCGGALRAHGPVEGAPQVCESLHRYARTSGACFSPPARRLPVRRAGIGVWRNVMRVDSHMGRGDDCDARCGFVARQEARVSFANLCTATRARAAPIFRRSPAVGIARRAVIGVRRNVMRVDSQMGRGDDCDERRGLMAP